jgi:hypothetical protein
MGSLIFDGIISEGFPQLGILYKLPRISIGKFSIPNKSNYKFIYKKTDLFLKSMKYSNMLQAYTLDGEIHNFAVDVEYICGHFPYQKVLLEGIYYLRSREGKVYVGSMRDSTRHGFGLMLLPNGHSMIGHWSKSRFAGVYRCPPPGQEKTALVASQVAGESVEPRQTLSKKSLSHYESVRRVSAFNKVPVEVIGNFTIAGDALMLADSGRIVFLDGSVYTGEISGNRMSGFGTMSYSTGESYSGQWRHNQPNGIGRLHGLNYVFEGQFKNGAWQGFGVLTLLAEQKKVKGEWDKGKLRFALIDEHTTTNAMLQVDKMHISVSEESNLFRVGKIELTGTCHVLFKEKAEVKLKPRAMHAEGESPLAESQHAALESEGQSQAHASHSQSPAHHRSSFGPKNAKPFQFIGIFKRNDWSTINGFALGQIIAIGYLVKGSEVLFKGMASYEFDRFFGVKFDHDTETELVGHFNSHLKLTGTGSSTRGEVRYIGSFDKSLKHGLIKKVKAGQTTLIAEYTEDKKHGFVLKFATDSPLLAEYSANTLKRIYYNLN